MQQIGFPQKITHAYFLYSKDQKVYWFALILHFSFSIVFSFIFVVLSQIWSGISLGEGALYGIIIWFLWHILFGPDDVNRVVSGSGKAVQLTVIRNNKSMDFSVTPYYDKASREYKLGLWIKEKIAGIGTEQQRLYR